METVESIRNAFKTRYPDVDDDEFSFTYSGFIHENPMTAIGVVLVSCVVLGTTDVNRLAEFTKYSQRFIGAIAANMENNSLWKDGKYLCEAWSSGNMLPRDEEEDHEFWEHIDIADGSSWEPNAKSSLSLDAGAIFWNEKLVN